MTVCEIMFVQGIDNIMYSFHLNFVKKAKYVSQNVMGYSPVHFISNIIR